MEKIYLIGDTHGQYSAIKRLFAEYQIHGDYVIVLGDFGFLWDKNSAPMVWQLDYLFSTHSSLLLFIDGNHENFEMLYSHEKTEWMGGEIRAITDSIAHLSRGQVFNLFGKKFFTMGGANSIDKQSRRNRISWWEEEDITYEDMTIANNNLALNNDTVDYVLTHTCPFDVKRMMKMKVEFDSHNENQLQHIANILNYKAWYFGHYHEDWVFGKFQCLYKDVVIID